MGKYNIHSGRYRSVVILLSAMLLGMIIVTPATAHLMVAQQGTLNIVDNGVFMVLSVPVSAFDNIDDDGDGKMSAAEFTRHRPAIVASVKEQVRLLDERGPRKLQGMMLTPVPVHDAPTDPTDQLIVMGRFVLANSRELRVQINLFGTHPEEQTITINATRASQPLKHKMVLTPKRPESWLFPAKN